MTALMRRVAVTLFFGFCAGSAFGADQGANAAPADRRLLNAQSEPQNWLTHGGTYLEQRYSTLDRINEKNVGTLGLAWSYELDTNRGQEATPLVVDGVLYTTTAWSKLVALDAATGRLLWSYDPKVPPETGVKACCDVVNRGAAFYDGKIFFATLDGRLIALDAGTGKLLWSVQTVDTSKSYTSTGAPRAVKGKIVIGNGGAELGVRGYVTAYDANTGKQVWRFYTVPGDPAKGPDGAASDDVLKAKARGTWFGDWYRYGGGGTVWDAIVYDPELDQLYIGVGNGSPWSQKARSLGKGDNLFLSSVVALNPDTGKYIWHYQETPGDTWDFTATQPMILATLQRGGKPAKVLLHAPKNGFFYVIDRASGQPLSAQNFTPVNWATSIDMKTGRPVEVAGARYLTGPFDALPSSYGSHSWQPMSFSPKTGLVYLPAQEIPARYEQEDHFKYRPGTWNLGAALFKQSLPDDPGTRKAIKALYKGYLLAWDPIAQREIWRVQHDGPSNGGTLATAGDLVFEGDALGTFRAYQARTGKRLWAFEAHDAIMAGPVSYAVGGEQYIAVMAGLGGGYGLTSPFIKDKRPKLNGRVLAFRLKGQAVLPPFDPPPLAPANPSRERFTPEQTARGRDVYNTTCGWCHGAGTESGGVIPDLRRSAILTDRDSWNQVVIGGLLKERGMVSFAKLITPADAEAIRAFVNQRAAVLQSAEQAENPGGAQPKP